MEHLKNKWHAENHQGRWVAVGLDGWVICEARKGFPDDISGEETCYAICNMHNAQLDAVPNQAPVTVDAEKEKRRHDDAKDFMAAMMVNESVEASDVAKLTHIALLHADALQAALEKGGKQ